MAAPRPGIALDTPAPKADTSEPDDQALDLDLDLPTPATEQTIEISEPDDDLSIDLNLTPVGQLEAGGDVAASSAGSDDAIQLTEADLAPASNGGQAGERDEIELELAASPAASAQGERDAALLSAAPVATEVPLPPTASARRKSDYASDEGPAPIFMLMGIGFTPIKAVFLLLLIVGMIGGVTWWATGPADDFKVLEVRTVDMMTVIPGVHYSELTELEKKMGKRSTPGAGGPDRLVAVQDNPDGQFLLIEVLVSQRLLEEQKLWGEYNVYFRSNGFPLMYDGVKVEPLVLREEWPSGSVVPLGQTKTADVRSLLPPTFQPSAAQVHTSSSEFGTSSRGRIEYDGASGALGQVDFTSSMGLGGGSVWPTGELKIISPEQIKVRIEYGRGGGIVIKWLPETDVWYGSAMYKLPEGDTGYHKYRIGLLVPRPKPGTQRIELLVGQRTVDSLSSDVALARGEPATIAIEGLQLVKLEGLPTPEGELGQAGAGMRGGEPSKPKPPTFTFDIDEEDDAPAADVQEPAVSEPAAP